MRDLAFGFAAYVVAILSTSALALYFLLPVAAGLRTVDAPPAVQVAIATETADAPEPPAAPPVPAVVEDSAPPAMVPSAPVSAPIIVVVDEVAAPETDIALARAAPDETAESEVEWSRVTKLGLAMDLIVAERAPDTTPAPDIAILLQRGDALLATGDVAAARLFYGRAAEHGDAAGALGVARTYDPLFLAQAGYRTARGDAAQATTWYRRAIAAGSADAAAPLERLLGPTIARDSALQKKS